MSPLLLIINPGSTSTKVAVFEGLERLSGEIIRHDPSELTRFDTIAGQFDYRMRAIDAWIASLGVNLPRVQAVVGRGAPLRPLEGGAYAITSRMLEDIRMARYADHASNLGALIAHQLGRRLGAPSLICDPVTVDIFTEVARVSGLPEIERKCRAHSLNIKEVCRRVSAGLGRPLAEVNFVVAHMGGGISVVALQGGRIIDANDALLGMGPFSPDRAGALPIGPLVKLCYSGRYSEKEMLDRLSRKSGLVAYVGESDLIKIEEMIERGDQKAQFYLNAMAYQIAKEIGAMAVVLGGDFEAIVLTGGMAHSTRLVNEITRLVSFLKRIEVVPGEFEMEALAAAGMRILSGQEQLKMY